MKTTLTKLLLIISSTIYLGSAYAQCTLDIFGDTLICPNESVTLTAVTNSTSLETTLTGGNNHRGNMFDVTAINAIVITSFDAHPMGNTDYEIYYKTGSYVGSTNTAANWTLVGSATGVVAQPFGTATPIPISVNITIPAGQTYSFYVTSTNTSVSQYYTNGTSAGVLYASDANLQFFEGIGIEYPFSGSAFSPRIWNGKINYMPVTTSTYLWNTGETSNSIVVSPSALSTYSVDVTSSGCGTLNDSITVDISDIDRFDLGLNDTLCLGDTINFDFSNFNGSVTWHNTSTIPTYFSDTTDTVSVELVDVAGCTKNDTVYIVSLSNPMINIGLDSIICYNDTLTLDAGVGNYQYLWSTNETTQTIDVYSDTTVNVTVTDVFGCSTVDSISLDTYYKPTLSDSILNVLCNQSNEGYISVSVDTSETNYSIMWDNGDTTFTRDSLYAGVYTYIVVDSNSCESYGNVTVTEPTPIILSSIVSNETVAGNGAIDVTISGGTPGFTYSWNNSETTEDIDSLMAGIYIITVTDMNGCQDSLSITINNTVGIEGKDLLDFNLYPNPTQGEVSILSSQAIEYLDVYNNLGQLVMTKGNVSNTTTIDLSTLQKGVYYIQLRSEDSIGIKQVIVK